MKHRFHISPCLVWLLILLMGVGCSSSLVEKNIKRKIPEPYKNHSSGIVTDPSEKDIQEAIALGSSSADQANVLDYAYIFKPDIDSYVMVRTPLYIVAHHALEQEREYREVESSLVEYAKSSGAVKIDFFRPDDPYAQQGLLPSVTLLLDGKRVEPLREIRLYEGENPYEKPSPSNFGAQKVQEYQQRAVQEMQAQYGQASNTGAAQSGRQKTELPENSNYFAVEDLTKPGKYEVVVRRARGSAVVSAVSGSTTKEERHTVDFSNIK